VLFVLFLTALRGGTPGGVLRALALVLLVGLGTSSISLGLGAAFPKLDWENPKQQTTLRAGCLTPILYIAYVGVAVAAVFGPPALAALLGPGWVVWFAVAGWLIVIALTGAVVWGALTFGAVQLDRIEVG
jgi:hypothetical protein